MGLFQKKCDPISDRSRELQAEISALEAQIKKLNGRLHTREAASPRVRSTAVPQNRAAAPDNTNANEPVFETVDQNHLKAAAKDDHGGTGRGDKTSRGELGMARNAPGLFGRFRGHFSPRAPAANPKLINYLAAGSIQGLRPLRYEKRVARNRFIFLTFILLLVLLWILAVFVR